MAESTTYDDICYEYSRCWDDSADTVVLVHGLGLDMTVWDDIIPFLKRKFHVLRYDLPGHGNSSYYLDEPVSWELLTTSFKKLLEHNAISKVHLIGHSGGGNLGIELVVGLKDVLLSLTLVATPIFTPKDLGKAEFESRMSVGNKSIEEIADPIIQNLCYPATDRKIEKLQSMYKKISVKNYLSYFKLFGETLLGYVLDNIKQIKTPMMMLVGEQDVLYPPQMQMLNMGYMPNASFYIIPNASNVIMMDQPEMFHQFFVQFIEKLNYDSAKINHKYNYTNSLSEKLHNIVDLGVRQIDCQQVIKIMLVDGFRVIINGQEVPGKWNQRKAKQLLIYLVLFKTVTRDKLFDVFWPDYDLSKARNYLRVSLNHIKGIIEDHTGDSIENYFSITRESIDVTARVETDLSQLIENLNFIEQEQEASSRFDLAIEQFAMLPVTLFPSLYDDWIIELKISLEERIITICENLLEEMIEDGQAIELLKILIKYNPVKDVYFDQLISLLQNTKRDKEADYYKNKRGTQQTDL